jgi:hypothetical protein
MTAQEQDVNDDNALMRFEWIEGMVRLAIAKFIQDKHITDDVSDAVNLLCMYHLSAMPPEAITDTNIFRRQRLYTEEMDSCLRVCEYVLDSTCLDNHDLSPSSDRSSFCEIQSFALTGQREFS